MLPVKFSVLLEELNARCESPSAHLSLLNDLLSCSANSEYKALLLDKSPLIKTLIDIGNQASQLQEVTVEWLAQRLEEDLKLKEQNSGELFNLLVLAWTVFMKENMTGQSVYTQYVEETKCPIDQSALPDLPFDPISCKNQKLQDALVVYYSIDSESFYQRTQFLVLFYLIELVLRILESNEHPEVKLWRARYSAIHNEILSSNSETLQSKILDNYRDYIS